MSTNEVETRARAMGWLPKEKFKGPESSWLEPAAYVERGESILPLLQANNRKLTDSVTRVESENNQLKTQLAAATEAIEGLKEFRSSVTKDKAKEQKRDLTAAIVQARKEGDVETEVALTEKLDEVKDTLKEAEKPVIKATDKPITTAPSLSAETQAWGQANPWFGTDKRKTGYAQGLRDEWVSQGKTVGTQEFFQWLDTEIEKQFDQNAERRNSQKVDATNNSSGGDSGPQGKSFADLPAEAKKACKDSAKKLVGPNRAYKTEAEWQAVYVSQYDWS